MNKLTEKFKEAIDNNTEQPDKTGAMNHTLAAAKCSQICEEEMIKFAKFIQTGKCWFDKNGNAATTEELLEKYKQENNL